MFLRQRIAATWTEMRTTHPAAMEAELQKMLSDENSSVREMAVVILGDTRAKGSIQALKKVAAEDENATVRAAAERALHALGE